MVDNYLDPEKDLVCRVYLAKRPDEKFSAICPRLGPVPRLSSRTSLFMLPSSQSSWWSQLGQNLQSLPDIGGQCTDWKIEEQGLQSLVYEELPTNKRQNVNIMTQLPEALLPTKMANLAIGNQLWLPIMAIMAVMVGYTPFKPNYEHCTAHLSS